jgi:hypothetical protein
MRSVEHDHFDTTGEHQSRYGVERVDLGSPGGDFGQVPPNRRSGSAHPTLSIEGSTSLDDPSDGPNRRRLLARTFEQGCVDCLGAVLTEVARFVQVFANGDDKNLNGALSTVDRMAPSSGLATPVDSVQPLPGRVLNPPLNHRQTDTELACRLAQTGACTDSLNHSLAALAGAFVRPATALLFARNLISLFCRVSPFRVFEKVLPAIAIEHAFRPKITEPSDLVMLAAE